MKTSILYATLLGAITFSACSNNPNNRTYKEHENVASTTIESAPASSEETANKLVKTADMSIKVSNVQTFSKNVSQLAQSMGGMIMKMNLSSVHTNEQLLEVSKDSLQVFTTYEPRADIIVRVPSQSLEKFMDEIAGKALFVFSRNLNIEDKTLDYLSAKMKADNRKKFANQQEQQKLKTADAGKVVDKKDEQIDQDIAKYRIDQDVAYSTVALNLIQNGIVFSETKANTNINNYKLAFGTSIQYAFLSGWELFKDFIILLAHLWFLFVVGLFIFIIYKVRNRNKIVVKVQQEIKP